MKLLYMQYFQGGTRGRLTQYPPLVLVPAPALKPQVTSAPGHTKKSFCAMQTMVTKLG